MSIEKEELTIEYLKPNIDSAMEAAAEEVRNRVAHIVITRKMVAINVHSLSLKETKIKIIDPITTTYQYIFEYTLDIEKW